MNLISEIEKEQLKKNIPPFAPGDTVKVQVRVVEGDKERLQAFQGVVIQRRGSGLSETFTVRRIASGIGVERIFPMHSPNLAKITIVKKGRVRRAKLFYLRTKRGKGARIEEKKTGFSEPNP
ncbi:MAG: 50S ribosomal protein L19 [Candidatus Edwardsbacteria bacterium]